MATYEQYLDTNMPVHLALKYAGMTRGFQEVKNEHKKIDPSVEIKLPTRGSSKSAGYDFYSTADILIEAGGSALIWTDVKAYMLDDEVLKIYPRSGLALKQGLIIKNTVGIIDADYFSNKNNDGNIGICLYNSSGSNQEIKIGDRIAQGIFEKYLLIDNDITAAKRDSGFGSTGK
jgi:dUTP pyrophosphatase